MAVGLPKHHWTHPNTRERANQSTMEPIYEGIVMNHRSILGHWWKAGLAIVSITCFSPENHRSRCGCIIHRKFQIMDQVQEIHHPAGPLVSRLKPPLMHPAGPHSRCSSTVRLSCCCESSGRTDRRSSSSASFLLIWNAALPCFAGLCLNKTEEGRARV